MKAGDLRGRGQFRSRGYGFVEFADVGGWKAALNANEEELTWEGRIIKVCEAKDEPKGEEASEVKNGVDGATPSTPFSATAEPCVGNDVEDDCPKDCVAPADDVDSSLSGAFAAASISAGDLSSSNDLSSSTDLSVSKDLSFAYLPAAVVVKIFSYLTLREKVEVELVSKRWRRLARSSWGSLTEFIAPKYRGLYAFGNSWTDRKFMG